MKSVVSNTSTLGRNEKIEALKGVQVQGGCNCTYEYCPDNSVRDHQDSESSRFQTTSCNMSPVSATESLESGRMNKAFGALKTLIVDSTEPHSATIIWLHSLGDSGKYFANEDGHGLDLPDVLAVPWCRFIFPTAADISITLHGGVQQPAWFDVERLDDRGVVQDDRGVLAAAQLVMDLVSNELRLGIPANRIVLAGFGQVTIHRLMLICHAAV
jgi:hypothetical protein